VESDLRSIGEMARVSGLTVSALRFYDRAGVLVPAVVDPATGYRRSAECQIRPARLLAGLRRVGMPLAEITRVLRRHGSSPRPPGRTSRGTAVDPALAGPLIAVCKPGSVVRRAQMRSCR
jgi:DNA polymerase III subunit beta